MSPRPSSLRAVSIVRLRLMLCAAALTACSSPAASTAAPTVAPAATTIAPTIAATTAPTVAPTAVPPTTKPSGPFTVFDWSGYELPDFWQPFADQHPDVTPEYSFFAEDAEAFAKAESGFQFDVIHPCSTWWQLYVDNGLVQPIDTSRLKNWSSLRPELAKLGQINGQQYFIPWEWGFESILVRTDKVKTIPASWADLWNAEYKGHLTIFDSGETNHAMAALALGLDPWKTTSEQDQQIEQKLLELKPNLLNYWADFTELNQSIASGDVWVVANAWNDAYVTAHQNDIPVEYLTPKEGRLSWVCGYGLSSKAQNVDLVYDYIDALIAPQSMANMSNQYAYGAANADALPLTDPDFVALFHLDDPDILNRTVFYQSLTSEQRTNFTNMWSAVKAAP